MAKDKEPLREKITRIESFLNETLRGDLEKILLRRDAVYGQLSDYTQLKATIEEIISNRLADKPLKTQVDLGCNFYMQAIVSEPTTICIDVGLGIYVQFNLPEAVDHIEKRMKLLEDSVLQLSKEAANVKAHIKVILEGLREMQSIDSEEVNQHRPVW